MPTAISLVINPSIRHVWRTKKTTAMKKFCLLLVVITASLALSSCNVTRTVTTKSEYWQKADTSVVIQTKTIETYDASKH
jgi:hypothetical protein